MLKQLLLILTILAIPSLARADFRAFNGPGMGLSPTTSGGGISYLLNDSFSTNLTEGNVNGTAAVPGPGTRTVVDTVSVLSLLGGKLTVGNATATNNPYLALNAVVRTIGRLLVGELTPTQASYGPRIGWSAALSSVPNSASHFYFRNTATLSTIIAGNPITIGSFSLNNSYKICCVLRGTGAFLLIKGGSYTNWYLLFISADINTTPMYPVITPNSAGASGGNYTSDFLRVPQTLWTLRPISADSFGGTWPTTDGGGLTGLEAGGDGKTWVANLGTWGISGGAAVCSALDGTANVGVATITTNTTDPYIFAKAIRSGNEVGIVTNYVDSANYIRAYHDGTNAKLDLLTIAEGAVNKISTVAAYSAGANIMVRSIGTSYYFWYNNAYMGSTTISDATIRASTKHGLYTTNTENSLDNAFIYASGSGGEYAILDAFSN